MCLITRIFVCCVCDKLENHFQPSSGWYDGSLVVAAMENGTVEKCVCACVRVFGTEGRNMRQSMSLADKASVEMAMCVHIYIHAHI